MALAGYLALLVTCFSLAQSITLNCFNCNGVRHPHHCRTHTRCHAEKNMCVNEAYEVNGEIFYDLSCKDINTCQTNQPPGNLIGKRSHGNTLRCHECCDTENCNRQLCANIHPVTTTTLQTTLQTTITTTTSSPQPPVHNQPTPEPDCRDHEEDGIVCATLDLFNLCTDTSTFGVVLAHKKCRKYCKICVPTSPQPAYPVGPLPLPGVCADYEQDSLMCVYFDLYNMCTDTTQIAHVIANMKCRKHCGFCTSTSGQVTSAPTTVLPTTVLPTTTQMIFTATRYHSTKSIIKSNNQTTLYPCIDINGPNVNCVDLASKGYCNPIASSGYEVARLMCRKTCGFC